MDVQKAWCAGRLIHMEHFSELIEQAHAGDKKARDTLVANNLGLVHAVARRFVNRGHDREEIFQIGCIGLMKAIDKFDVTLQLAFSTYAVPMIAGEIRRFLRDDGMVKVSRTLKENGYRIKPGEGDTGAKAWQRAGHGGDFQRDRAAGGGYCACA